MFQCLSVLGPTSLDYECALPLQNHPINEAVGSRKQRPLGLRRTVVFGRLRLTSASQIPDGRVLIGPLPRASSLAGLCSTVTSLRSNHASAEYNSSGELCLARAARPGRHPVALGAPRGGSHGRSAEALPRRSPVPRARPLEPLGRGLSAEDPSTAAAPLGSPAQQRAAQSFLRSLGLDDAAVRKALGRYPGIVTHSVQRKQKPLVRELKQRFGITRREAGSMIVKAPKLAAVSLEKLQEVDSLLTGALGLKRRDARRCLVRFPNLLNMSVSRNALPTIACLLEMGLTREEVAAMVVSMPPLLSLDFTPGSRQQRKARFFVEVMGKVWRLAAAGLGFEAVIPPLSPPPSP